MGPGLHLARIGGIDVHLDWSLLLIFVLVTTVLGAGLFPQWHPDWSLLTTWATAVAAAICFFASVLVHELSHAWVGRARGVDIRRITLFVFGGMAHIEQEPRTWRAEFWMAIVGPFTSLGLGVVFIALGSALAGNADFTGDDPAAAFASLGPLATLLFWLGPVNILLGLFNLVPGFPLDGGRVLRAILWGVTGDLRSATRWASNGGRAFGWLLILSGVAMVLGVPVWPFGAGLVNGLWIALIGWFLHNAALMSYRQLVVRESLEDVPASRLMHTRLEHVAPGLAISDFVDDYLLRGEQRAYPVVEGSRFVGLVRLKDLRNRPRSEWDGALVSSVMTAADELVTVAPGTEATKVVQMLEQRGMDYLPVLERGGRLVGLISRDDVHKWLSLRGGSAPARADDAPPSRPG